MTFAQAAIVAILLGMLVAYATERFRVELVALCGLSVGFLTGIVPVQNVFAGFASSAVITVVEVLLVVAALSRTRVIDSFARRIVYHVQSERAVLAIICATGAAVSVFMNNIGALALMFPVTMSVCQRLDVSPSRMLMPLSFATLLGGMCSLTGTPANLVVNQWLIGETGRGFGYFELALLGGPLTLLGLAWIVFAAPGTFARFRESSAAADPSPAHFVAERRVPEGSPVIGRRLPQIEDDFGVLVHGVIREGAHVFARRSDIALAAGDIVVAEADLSVLDQLEEAGRLVAPHPPSDAAERQEYVVMPESLLLGSRLGAISSFAEHSLQVIGLAVRRGRIEGSFDELQIGMGDVLVLSGERDDLRQIAAECSLLPLSPRRPSPFTGRAWLSVGIFALGIVVTAFDLVPTEIAFGAVVVAMALVGSLNLRTALQDLNWSIVILLACMIPLGLAVEDTGAARLIANEIAAFLPTAQPLVVGTTMLLLAVVITPFIDNVSVAAVLSPIAAGLASRTGTPIGPVLMAVAIGASLDFSTPFGHHNNALVMGAGGYRFMDFPRFGIPLTILCFALAVFVLSLMLPG
ncbi:MAG: SLC13 family permease [Croceibacterium sp.]